MEGYVVRKYAVCLGVFSLFLVACGVPEEQYDAVVAERDSLQSSLLELEDTLKTVITQNDTLEIDLDALTTQNHMNAAKIDELEEILVMEESLRDFEVLFDDDALQILALLDE